MREGGKEGRDSPGGWTSHHYFEDVVRGGGCGFNWTRRFVLRRVLVVEEGTRGRGGKRNEEGKSRKFS